MLVHILRHASVALPFCHSRSNAHQARTAEFSNTGNHTWTCSMHRLPFCINCNTEKVNIICIFQLYNFNISSPLSPLLIFLRDFCCCLLFVFCFLFVLEDVNFWKRCVPNKTEKKVRKEKEREIKTNSTHTI